MASVEETWAKVKSAIGPCAVAGVEMTEAERRALCSHCNRQAAVLAFGHAVLEDSDLTFALGHAALGDRAAATGDIARLKARLDALADSPAAESEKEE